MASNKQNKGSFVAGNKAAKGNNHKQKKTLILEAITEAGLLGLEANATKEEAETAVFKFLAQSAFTPTPETAAISNTALTQLLRKGWADIKPQDECIKFTLTSRTITGKAQQIVKAISTGEIPPSVGVNLLTAMSSMLKIKEITELEDRIKALEKDAK